MFVWTTSQVAEAKSQSQHTSSPLRRVQYFQRMDSPALDGLCTCICLQWVSCSARIPQEWVRHFERGRKVRYQGSCELWNSACGGRWGCWRSAVRSHCLSVPLPFSFVDSELFSFYRCLLHCYFVVLVESHCHHSGELSSPLRPEVPEAKVFSSKLLKAHILGLLSFCTRDKCCTWLRGKNRVVVTKTNTSDICIRIMW